MYRSAGLNLALEGRVQEGNQTHQSKHSAKDGHPDQSQPLEDQYNLL